MSRDPNLFPDSNERRSVPIEVDLFSEDILKAVELTGKLYRRKVLPIREVHFPTEPKQVDTIIDGVLETSVVAVPGQHMVITGAKGENYRVETSAIGEIYDIVPRDLLLIAVPNPYGQPIKIRAPWSKPGEDYYQDGAESCVLAFKLDEEGNLTDDRYIIQDSDLLDSNYDPVDIKHETEKIQHKLTKLDRILHKLGYHASEYLVSDTTTHTVTCQACGTTYGVPLAFP
jgi:hypothetical protein